MLHLLGTLPGQTVTMTSSDGRTAMSGGNELRMPEPDVTLTGGHSLAGEFRCDVEGCPRIGGFSSMQGLHAHRWQAHRLRKDENLTEVQRAIIDGREGPRGTVTDPNDKLGRQFIVSDHYEREAGKVGEATEDEECARVLSVGISEQHEVDVLDAWCFLHGVENTNEWLTHVVNDMIETAAHDETVMELVALREKRRDR